MASKTSTRKRMAKEESVSEVVPVVPIIVSPLEVDATPVVVAPESPPAPLLVVPKRPKQPLVPKAFRGALAYAQKRFRQATKERTEAMAKTASLNIEISYLIQNIRALGSTPDVSGLQTHVPSFPSSQEAFVDPYANLPNNVDPALIQANSGPVPVPQTPLIPNTANGGAMDLDYTPVVEEGPPLPRMGGGWV
jgi:hypothetical protein